MIWAIKNNKAHLISCVLVIYTTAFLCPCSAHAGWNAQVCGDVTEGCTWQRCSGIDPAYVTRGFYRNISLTNARRLKISFCFRFPPLLYIMDSFPSVYFFLLQIWNYICFPIECVTLLPQHLCFSFPPILSEFLYNPNLITFLCKKIY